jgi:hypothetical protein
MKVVRYRIGDTVRMDFVMFLATGTYVLLVRVSGGKLTSDISEI